MKNVRKILSACLASVMLLGCFACGSTSARILPAAQAIEYAEIDGEHLWVEEGRTIYDCITGQDFYYICLYCDETKTKHTDGTGEHVNVKQIIVEPATCCTTGIAFDRCTDCGIESENYELAFNETHVGKVEQRNATAAYSGDYYCTACNIVIAEGTSNIHLVVACGDSDGDNRITSSDARIALRYSVGLEELSDEQAEMLDANGDGVINSSDARLILRFSVGLADKKDNVEIFNKPIGYFESDNVLQKYADGDPTYSDAYLSIYLPDNSADSMAAFIEKFADTFGYEPQCEIHCDYLGDYLTDCSGQPNAIYHYYVYDDTYLLLVDTFYEVYKQPCDDGSPWVGFVVPGTLHTVDNDPLVSGCKEKMFDMFCEWTGRDLAEMKSDREHFGIGYYSTSTARTLYGEVIPIIYIYARAYGITIEEFENAKNNQ